MMRGPRQDDDSVIENPLKLGLIQANPMAIGLLHASRNTRKLKITAAAECDRALLERSCEPEELKGVKWYESYNAILRDPDATTRVDSVFIGGTTSTRSQWAVAAAQHNYPGATLVTIDPGWVQTDMGGGTAPLTVQDSVRGLRNTLVSVTPADKGRLLHHDGRRATHW